MISRQVPERELDSPTPTVTLLGAHRACGGGALVWDLPKSVRLGADVAGEAYVGRRRRRADRPCSRHLTLLSLYARTAE